MVNLEGAPSVHTRPVTVQRALEEVLCSRSFRNSKQCREMLLYIVEQSLRHDQEALRERVIGVEVFGRNPDYDTGEDPVVRIRASDIRKRLAQYYQSPEAKDVQLRIEIPSGSYRAHFEVVTLPETLSSGLQPGDVPSAQSFPGAEATAEIRRKHRLSWGIGIAATIVIAVVAALWGGAADHPRADALDLFWAPVVHNSRPVLIYAGANALYRLSDSFLNSYSRKHHIDTHGAEFFVNLPPGTRIDASDLVPVTDTTSDAVACAEIVALVTKFGRPYELRYGTNVAIGDLVDSPTVLIGAFNDKWTLDMTDHLRFVFENGTEIVDTSGQTKGWKEEWQPNGQMSDDYAVITRLINPQSGRVLITAAGIGSFGTHAAAEFLTNPREMAELQRAAPQGWQNKDLQIVLHVSVLNNSINETHIVATQFW